MSTAIKYANWHASQLRKSGPSIGIDIGAADGANICLVWLQEDGGGETIRLANLIKSAPDLHAAALRAYELCEGLADGAPDAPEYAKEAGRVAEELWAAIEKANQ
jgi:hypothetical protein